MTRQSYNIATSTESSPPSTPRNKDTSFRSFITVLLIFLIVCLVIFLASFNWRAKKSAPLASDEVEVVKNYTDTEKDRFVIFATTNNIFVLNTTTAISSTIAAVRSTTDKIEDFGNDIDDTRQPKAASPSHPPATTTIFVKTTDNNNHRQTTELPKVATTNIPINVTKKSESAFSTQQVASVNNITTEDEITTIEITTNRLTNGINSTLKIQESTTTSTPKFIPHNITRETETNTTTNTSEEQDTSTETTIFVTEPPTTSRFVTATKNQNESTTDPYSTRSPIATIPDSSVTNQTEIADTTSIPILKQTEIIITTIENLNGLTTTTVSNQQNSTFSDLDKVSESNTTIINSPSTEKIELIETTSKNQTSLDQATETTFDFNTLTTKWPGRITETLTQLPENETTEIIINRPTSTTPPNPTTPTILRLFKNATTCQDPICNKEATKMLNLIKHSAKGPCEDFYEFACGGIFPSATESAASIINDMLSTYLNDVDDLSVKYLRNFRNFYDSCNMYEDAFKYDQRIFEVKNLLSSVGTFETNYTTTIDMTDLFIQLIERQSLPFFDIGIDIDDNSEFILQITLPQLSTLRNNLDNWPAINHQKQLCIKHKLKLFNNEYENLTLAYESYIDCLQNHTNYLDTINETLEQIKIFDHLSSIDRIQEIQNIISTIEYDILNKLNHFPSAAEIKLIQIDRKYQLCNVSDLQDQLGLIDWKRFLSNLTDNSIDDSYNIQFYFQNEFIELFKSLQRMDKRKLKNALLAIYANDLYYNLVIPKGITNRDTFCLGLTRQLFPDVTFYLIQNVFQLNVIKGSFVIQRLFITLIQNFKNSFKMVEWLDDTSKDEILNKIQIIHLRLLSNLEDQVLTNYSNNIEINENYQKNLVNLIINRRRIVWANAGHPISASDMYANFLDPSSNEPLSVKSDGSIYVPFSLLMSSDVLPFYYLLPKFGLHLAKAIARQLDKKVLENLMSSSSKKYYRYLVTTMEDQMSFASPRLFGNHNISFQMNGQLSLNERIIDNTAFRMVLDSLEASSNQNNKLLEWISSTYSREKIVFIAAAQEYCRPISLADFILHIYEDNHLPPELKVENIIENSDSFAERFNCPSGSGMTLLEEKLQFPYLLEKSDDYGEEDEYDMSET